MRYTIRALGWATKILWILVIAFSATAVYSVMNVKMGIGQPQVIFSEGVVVISIPLLVNNTGFYDLSDLNLTVRIADPNGSLASASTTFIPLIPRGSSIETAHNISINPGDTAAEAPNYLFNDASFNVNTTLRLKFAQSIPFQVSANTTIPWGAPLYNFSVGQISYRFCNFTHQIVIIPLSFENHSPYFGVDGTMHIEIYNNRNELLSSEALDLGVPPQSTYSGRVEPIVDASKLTSSGEMQFFFETSLFSYGPVVIPYG